MKHLIAEDKKYFTPLACALFMSAALSACGGGGGGGSSTTPAIPGAATLAPVDGATGVERDAVITATFSEDMLSTSIDETSFLLDDGSAVPGVVAFDALTNVATLTPSADLALLRSYTASLTSSIADLGGDPITAMNWSFTTRDGVWGTIAQAEADDATDASYPQIAFDPAGNAIAVWVQGNDIYANRYDAATGLWGTAESIEALAAGGAQPQIAMDGDGNAIAVWSHSVSAEQTIYSNRYTVGVGWGTAEPIESNVGNALYPKIAIDGAGNAIVTWLQPANAIDSIWVNHYDNGGAGWTAADAALLEAVDGIAYEPQLAVNADGDAVVVWAQDNLGGYDAIFAAYYTAGVSWSAAAEIGEDSSDSLTPQIAMDGDGNAMAVWEQPSTGAGPDSIWANRYSGGAWGTAAVIESQSLTAADPQIAFDGIGNAMAVWRHNGRVRYNVYTSGSGWGSDDAVETGADSISFPQFALDSAGNAIAVWRQSSNSVNNTWFSRYQVGSGWGTAALLEDDDTNSTTSAEIAVDANGSAIAIWVQSDGTAESVSVMRFD